MTCWNKEDLENMLRDVVDVLNLSDLMIEKHGPLGTAPAELVRLVLDRKDIEIEALKRGFKAIGIGVIEWVKCEESTPPPNLPVLVFYKSPLWNKSLKTVAIFMDGIEWRTQDGGHKFDNQPTHWSYLMEDPK